MLKVLLVDDEPFILQGLQMLIDWNKEGYETPLTASNGMEALGIVSKEKIDLIIADIKMPIMTGLELLKAMRETGNKNTYFVILSGYADFSFAQEALRYDCADYLLKPVEKESLTEVLKKVSLLKASSEERSNEDKIKEKAYLDRNLIAIILGKSDTNNLAYVKKFIDFSDEMRYVEIQLDTEAISEELSDEGNRLCLRKLYDASQDFLKEFNNYCVLDVSVHEKIYDIGFLYTDKMSKSRQMGEKEFFKAFHKYLRDVTQLPITMIVGKKVNNVPGISKSYGTSYMLRSLQGFRDKKDIYFYEEEVQVSDGGIVLCKKSLDNLIDAIEQNEPAQIIQKVNAFYEEMQKMGVTGETMNLNINYFLFQLIHLATELDDEVNQEEILRIISESTFEEGMRRGSKSHLSKMAKEYGEYLAQLRNNVSRGVLADVEREIKNRYASNITLKELSEKYYVNSAYLGQIFRKNYGCSFKDYLNKYRMDEAAKLLIRTNMKIYEIAETVGYKDVDYFVNRFIAVKGCTPAKYRKEKKQGEV